MVKASSESMEMSLQIRIAGNFIERARGLLFSDPLPEGHFLYIPNCRSVHTFGMRYPLIVIFLDQEGHVLHVYQNVKPMRIVSCLGLGSMRDYVAAGERTRYPRLYAIGGGSGSES